MTNYQGHEQRSTLWDLDPDKLYLVEGKPSGVYNTTKRGNTRFALKDVLVRDYDKNVVYDESPVVAFADHINVFRKSQGMSLVDLEGEGVIYFLGKQEIYTTRDDVTERVSLKLFRDVDVRRALLDLYRRCRNLETQWVEIGKEERSKRLARTNKDIERLQGVLSTYDYIPWMTPDALHGHLQQVINKVEEQHLLNNQ